MNPYLIPEIKNNTGRDFLSFGSQLATVKGASSGWSYFPQAMGSLLGSELGESITGRDKGWKSSLGSIAGGAAAGYMMGGPMGAAIGGTIGLAKRLFRF